MARFPCDPAQHLVHRFFERLTVQAREDLFSGLDPNERLALVVPSVQEALDGLDQGCQASEDAAPDGPAAEDGEPSLDLVQPASAPLHIAQNINSQRGSKIDGRTTSHPGYAISQRL